MKSISIALMTVTLAVAIGQAAQAQRGQGGRGLGGAQIPAQADRTLGAWRGTVKAADGTETPMTLTIAMKNGERVAAANIGDTGDAPLRKLVVDGNHVTIEGAADSAFGAVTLSAELTADGNGMAGAGQLGVGPSRTPVTFTLQRRGRPEVTQHQVEQRAQFFAGRWKFDYTGGEFPPLSQGGRRGTVTFTAAGGNQSFLTGKVDGDLDGKAYQEAISIGVNAESKTVVFWERHADGVELLSVGDWHSPLAIVFQTSPVSAGGKTYQLRRTLSVLSDTSFDMLEEFSVDGGPFKRLGQARYSRLGN